MQENKASENAPVNESNLVDIENSVLDQAEMPATDPATDPVSDPAIDSATEATVESEMPIQSVEQSQVQSSSELQAHSAETVQIQSSKQQNQIDPVSFGDDISQSEPFIPYQDFSTSVGSPIIDSGVQNINDNDNDVQFSDSDVPPIWDNPPDYSYEDVPPPMEDEHLDSSVNASIMDEVETPIDLTDENALADLYLRSRINGERFKEDDYIHQELIRRNGFSPEDEKLPDLVKSIKAAGRAVVAQFVNDVEQDKDLSQYPMLTNNIRSFQTDISYVLGHKYRENAGLTGELNSYRYNNVKLSPIVEKLEKMADPDFDSSKIQYSKFFGESPLKNTVKRDLAIGVKNNDYTLIVSSALTNSEYAKALTDVLTDAHRYKKPIAGVNPDGKSIKAFFDAVTDTFNKNQQLNLPEEGFHLRVEEHKRGNNVVPSIPHNKNDDWGKNVRPDTQTELRNQAKNNILSHLQSDDMPLSSSQRAQLNTDFSAIAGKLQTHAENQQTFEKDGLSDDYLRGLQQGQAQAQYYGNRNGNNNLNNANNVVAGQSNQRSILEVVASSLGKFVGSLFSKTVKEASRELKAIKKKGKAFYDDHKNGVKDKMVDAYDYSKSKALKGYDAAKDTVKSVVDPYGVKATQKQWDKAIKLYQPYENMGKEIIYSSQIKQIVDNMNAKIKSYDNAQRYDATATSTYNRKLDTLQDAVRDVSIHTNYVFENGKPFLDDTAKPKDIENAYKTLFGPQAQVASHLVDMVQDVNKMLASSHLDKLNHDGRLNQIIGRIDEVKTNSDKQIENDVLRPLILTQPALKDYLQETNHLRTKTQDYAISSALSHNVDPSIVVKQRLNEEQLYQEVVKSLNKSAEMRETLDLSLGDDFNTFKEKKKVENKTEDALKQEYIAEQQHNMAQKQQALLFADKSLENSISLLPETMKSRLMKDDEVSDKAKSLLDENFDFKLTPSKWVESLTKALENLVDSTKDVQADNENKQAMAMKS